MKSAFLTTTEPSTHAAELSQPVTTMGRIAYRFGLVIFGLLWVFLSSTLCGCGAMNGYVMNRSGKRYFDKGNYEFARYEFERALMDDPHNANYAFNVARTMQKEGEYESAELMYQHALTINPDHQPSYHSLASMLREQGRTAESQQLLVAWAETQPYSVDAQMSAANFYQQQGNQAAAQQHYQQAIRNQPPTRRQQRMANAYSPQSQSMMHGPQPQMASARYPYHTPPSMQMAATMPQNDFTMMGGPVVDHRALASVPHIQQQAIPAGPTWTPTEGVPVPQQYMQPTPSSNQPQLLPELPAPTSQSNPQAFYSQQQYASFQSGQMPVQGAHPQTVHTGMLPPQQMTQPVTQNETYEQFPGQYSEPQAVHGTPFQNISTHSEPQMSVVPAVQAF